MCARAGVGLPTLRIYEASRDAVTPTVRERLDRAYRELYESFCVGGNRVSR